MYHKYPYTTYYSDVDKICGACHACGLRLVIQGDYLRLVDGKGNVLSNVQVSYAEKAMFDKDGKAIEAYIFDVSEDGTHIVFTRGDGTYKTITVPYSEKAAKDLQGKDILNYSYALSISGDKLRITKGDGSVYELTIPYAVKASEDSEGKDITTYAATLEVDGDELVLRDSKGRQLSRITVPYADEAAQAEEANHALAADHALEADEADHATDADSADYATLSTDATNAIESLVITGDQLVATTYGGTQVTLTIPYAVKAQRDDVGNIIKTTYVAGVAQDSQTGEISFYDATGAVITSLVPTASVATYDSYGNTIADYIKTVTVTQGSDYVTVVHGTGTTDSIKIDYSTRAWKDTNNNVIKNFYVSYLECVEDVDDGHYKLVWYDGDNPRAELGRCEVWAYKAQVDVNNKALTSYVADLDITNNGLVVKDGEGNTLETLTLPSHDFIITGLHTSVTPDNWADYATGTNLTGDPVITTKSGETADITDITDGEDVILVIDYSPLTYVFTLSKLIRAADGTITMYFSSMSYDHSSGFKGIESVRLINYQGYWSQKKGFATQITSGGGGGSSTTILGLYDPNQGNLVALNSLSPSMTVEVWDITDIANPVQLDDTAFLAKIQVGQCYFKDSRNNTYSVVYDATAHNIGVIFNAAGVPYFVSIDYQWNNNWNIMVLKPIALQ